MSVPSIPTDPRLDAAASLGFGTVLLVVGTVLGLAGATWAIALAGIPIVALGVGIRLALQHRQQGPAPGSDPRQPPGIS